MPLSQDEQLTLYCDGAAKGCPGIGASAYLCLARDSANGLVRVLAAAGHYWPGKTAIQADDKDLAS